MPAPEWLKRSSTLLHHSTAPHHTSRFRERWTWTWTLDAGRWTLDAAGLAVSCPLHLRPAPGETQGLRQHVASLIEQWKSKTALLCPSSRYASAPLLALSLLERTVRRVMKQRHYVESQCAEHGSLCPALYCPDGPSRMEYEPLRMAFSKLGLC